MGLVSKLGQKLEKRALPEQRAEASLESGLVEEGGEDIEPDTETATVSGFLFGGQPVAPEPDDAIDGPVVQEVISPDIWSECIPIKTLEKEVVASVMRTPTKYRTVGGWSYFPDMLGRIFLRPTAELIKDEKQVQYLLDEIKELQKGGFTDQTWRDSVSTWLAFLNLYKQLDCECGLSILECIAADQNVADAIGAARPMVEINGNLPSDILIMLNKGPANHIRDHAYQYIRRLEKEAAMIRRIQEYQARAFALVGTTIVAAFVSVGNFIARVGYEAYKTNPSSIYIWAAVLVGSFLFCCACCGIVVAMLRKCIGSGDGNDKYEKVQMI